MEELEEGRKTHQWALPFSLPYRTILENKIRKGTRAGETSLIPPTSYGRPFRIDDDGKVHVVPRLNK